MKLDAEFINVFWIKDGVGYPFQGRTPFYAGELNAIGIYGQDAIDVIKYGYFLTCYKKPYQYYRMIFFDGSQYDNIIHIIEPNKKLKFKEYSPNKCKWIYSC